MMQGRIISKPFRERLMLAVTAVNKCKYCSYAHSQMALANGINQVEIEELAKGQYSGSPSNEIPALLYAQHWAENDGKPDDNIRKVFVERYGKQVADAIDLALLMIRVGNLSGNTFDKILKTISFGLIGN